MSTTSDTLRDLVSGFSSMSAQLGLTPLSGRNTFPMPVTPMPQIKHPGQISQELSVQATQAAQFTMQSTMQTRQMPAPGVMGLQPTSLLPPSGPAPGSLGGAGGGADAFSMQYQQRMQNIESGYLSPYTANWFSQKMGQSGFMNLPSPIYRTAPSMGIFRPHVAMPPPISFAQQRPLFMTPFTPQVPHAMYEQAWEHDYRQDQMRNQQLFAGAMSAGPTAAYMGTGALTTLMGGSVGAEIGRGLAKPFAGVGRMGGLVAGAALGFGVLGQGMEQLTAKGAIDPWVNLRLMGKQLETASRGFVVGGSDLNPILGQGLSASAGIRLANRMEKDVSRGLTGGFNLRDMAQMTGLAGDTGMLDMAQSSEQIAAQMRNVARSLQSFMRIAQEPDIRRAMQQMASFRAMGLTLPETNIAQANMVQFARMAGVSQQALGQTAGLPGAMVFQQLGLTGGLGYQVGGAAAAMAQQGIASGAFNPAQLAMAGGKQGLTQILTEAAGAGLGVDFPILSMLSRNARGELAIDPQRLKNVMSGRVSLAEQAQMAGENVNRLGGDRAIMEISTRMNELRDQMGRMLGPQGSVMYTMSQATALMRQVPNMSFGGALQHLGMNPQYARAIEIQASDEGFWRDRRRQQGVTIQQMRQEEWGRLEATRDYSSLSGRLGHAVRHAGIFRRPGEIGHDIGAAVSEWWSDRDMRQAATARGGVYVDREASLVTSGREREAVMRYIGSAAYQRDADRMARQYGQGIGDYSSTAGQIAGAAWNVGSTVGLAVATGGLSLGAGLMFKGVGGALLDSSAPDRSPVVQALRAQGGLAGTLAETLPGVTTLIGALGGSQFTKKMVANAQEAGELGHMVNRAKTLTDPQVLSIQNDLETSFRAYARVRGKDQKVVDKKDVLGRAAMNVAKLFEENAHWYGDRATTPMQVKQRIKESLIAQGVSEDLADEWVQDKAGSGLIDTVVRRAEAYMSPSGKAALAKTQANAGTSGLLAGVDLASVREKAADQIEDLKEYSGFYEGFDSPEESWNLFREQMVAGSADEMLFLAATAVGKKDETLGTALQSKLKDQFKGRYNEMMRQAESRFSAMTDKEKDMFTRYGTRHVAGKSYNQMRSSVEKVQSGLKQAFSSDIMMQGASKLKEAGLEAFGDFMQVGGAEKVINAVNLKADRLHKLQQLSPKAAAAARAYKAASSDAERQDALRDFNVGVAEMGGESGEALTLGGAGVGGAGEQSIREQQEVESRIRTAIKKGKPQEAFSEAVPSFSKASNSLHKGATALLGTVQEIRQLHRLPPIPNLGES